MTKKPPASPSPIRHPKCNDKGQPVWIARPSQPTTLGSWSTADAIAMTVPGGELPAGLGGTPLQRWTEAPGDAAGWRACVPDDLVEPPPVHVVSGSASPRAITVSGVICREADGRIWLVHPSNGFAGYRTTFPKGQLEAGLSLAANAIKEAWEESGLRVELVRYLFDVDRESASARYYLARRIGGSPADMGWESQAVSLCPLDQVRGLLNHPRDFGTFDALLAALKQSQCSGNPITSCAEPAS